MKDFLPCPLCQTPAIVRWQLPNTRIRRCLSARCGLCFSETQPSDTELEQHYRQLYYPASADAHASKPASDEAKLEQHFVALDTRLQLRGKRILEVGCGIGNFLATCSRHDVQAEGIETDARAVAQARQRGLRVVTDARELSPASFDLIYMNDVIEHLRSPWTLCSELRPLLGDRGSIFVATVRISGLSARLLGARWSMLRDPTHFYFFTERSLARVLTHAGFHQPEALAFPVRFSHHSMLRSWLQRGLVASRLDSSIKMIAHASRQ